jgi:NhaP-type Na+/H+ or K+/H+ antiporter
MGMLFAKSIFASLEENFDTITSSLNEQQTTQIKAFMEMGSGIFIIACGIYLLILGLSAFGALQMWQNKYKGFSMYVVANACFIISNLISLNIFMAAIDAIFIYLYYKNTRALKRY